jgi:hypothetical protein
MKRATNFWTVQLVTLLLALIMLSGFALAANNPGHDTLYIEQSGDSVLTGNLNISYLLTVEGNLYLKSYLDLIANGTVISSSPSRNTIYGTNTLLEIDAVSGGNIYLDRYGGTVLTGSPSARTDLNVSGNLYIYNPTGYTTLTVGNVAVCLANGTGCPTININGASSGGGWTNTTQNTTTTLNVGIGTTGPTSSNLGGGTPILDISGTAPTIALHDTTTNARNFSIFVDSNNFYIRDDSSTKFLINSSTGNIGVGTTNPTSTLHVNGQTNTTYLTIANNTASNCDLKADTSGNVYCGTDAAGGSGGWTDDGTVVRLTTSSDAVAIGTNSVSAGGGYTAKLHLYADYPALVFTSTVGSNKVGIGTDGTGVIDFFDTTSDVYSMKMRIQNDGRVGIGSQATNPSTLLEVRGNVSFNQTLYVTTNGTVGIGTLNPSVAGGYTPKFHVAGEYATMILEGTASAKKWGIGVDSTGKLNILESTSGATTRILIANGTGYVGIGTSTPTSTLHISGVINTTYLTLASATAASCDLKAFTNGTVYCGTDADTNSGGTVTGTGTGAYIAQFQSASAINSSVIYQNATDGIGIGTTTPGGSLDVVKSQNAGTTIRLENSNLGGSSQAYFHINNNYANTYIGLTGANFTTSGYFRPNGTFIANTKSGIDLAATDTTGNIKFWTGGSNQRMIIDSDGEVGIGATSPGAMLHIEDNVSTLTLETDYALKINDGAGSTGLVIGTASASSAGIIQTLDPGASWSTENLALQPNGGSVGIGTVSPASMLDVRGNISFNQTLYVQNNGSVGIGTSNPKSKLHITNVIETRDGGWQSALDIQATGPAANFPAMYFSGQNTTAYSAIIWTNSTSGNSNSQITGSIYVQPTNSTNANMYFATNDALGSGSYTNKVAILGNGRVGINTTSPSQMLHVRGNVQADAYLMNSDERLKKNIEQISGLAIITSLRGVRFAWNATNTTEIGVIAQDVEKVLPELVVTDENGYKAVKYSNLVGPLIESVKDLNDNDKETEREMEMMQSEIAALKKEIEMLKQVRR